MVLVETSSGDSVETIVKSIVLYRFVLYIITQLETF